MAAPSRLETLQQLTQQLRQFERDRAPRSGSRLATRDLRRATGIAPLDGVLPDGGFREGTLCEWLAPGPGSGAGTLAFAAAAGLLQTEGVGVCLVVDAARTFYPPAVSSRIDLRRMVVVHPANANDELWALEQSLRCRGVTATIGWIERIDDRAYRRLQLAAETGGGFGLLLRPAKFRSEPAWAELRLLVEPVSRESRVESRERKAEGGASPSSILNPQSSISSPSGRRLRVCLLHCRGGTSGACVELEIDDETGDVRAVAPLAVATAAARATGT